MRIPEFKLERYYGRYEFTVPLQLSASDCEPLTAAEVLKLAGLEASELLERRLGYTETRGAEPLRAAIAGFYPDRTPDDVMVVNAPEEAIFLAMHALLEPGDRVVVMTPCYQSLRDLARQVGCRVIEWRAIEGERGWSFDTDELARLLEPGARLVVTNAPHNPTGFQPDAEAWRRIAALTLEHGCHWFSDEMYRGLEPDAASSLPPAASIHPRALSLWGLSKSFGMPGLRCGWLVSSDPGALKRIEVWKDYTSICSNALSEELARAALGAADAILARYRELIARNRDAMAGFATRHADSLHWIQPAAGPVSLVRLRDESAEAHAARVRENGALLVPATMFDLGDEHLRIGLGRAGFARALECWEAAG